MGLFLILGFQPSIKARVEAKKFFKLCMVFIGAPAEGTLREPGREADNLRRSAKGGRKAPQVQRGGM